MEIRFIIKTSTRNGMSHFSHYRTFVMNMLIHIKTTTEENTIKQITGVYGRTSPALGWRCDFVWSLFSIVTCAAVESLPAADYAGPHLYAGDEKRGVGEHIHTADFEIVTITIV